MLVLVPVVLLDQEARLDTPTMTRPEVAALMHVPCSMVDLKATRAAMSW